MINNNFQTPNWVCSYMAYKMSELNPFTTNVLEPTAGEGNLVKELESRLWKVTAPKDFFEFIEFGKFYNFDGVVMNPPFTPMKLGYDILFKCMEYSNYIVALMPWLTIINSQKRLEIIKKFGLDSVTYLPRYAFPGSRVQTCILGLKKYNSGGAKFYSIRKKGENDYEFF